MRFTHRQSRHLRTAILLQSAIVKTAILIQSAIVKTLSLTENLDFAPVVGPIEARQFFKIRTRREKPEAD